MTAGELRRLVAKLPDNARVLFAECEHHHIEVDACVEQAFRLYGVGELRPFVILKSTGWTDDCDCDEDAKPGAIHEAVPLEPDCAACGRPMGPDDIADTHPLVADICIPCAEPAEPVECPQCGGPAGELGSLGNVVHLSCRNCGWQFSRSAEPPDQVSDR